MQVLYGIPDIRLFWSHDSGFTSQFTGRSPNESFKYRPVSVHPQVYFDLSFWLPEGATPEEVTANTYDLIRSVGGSLIEQVFTYLFIYLFILFILIVNAVIVVIILYYYYCYYYFTGLLPNHEV